MKAKVLLITLFILNIFQVSAQNKDEITLVVSADGATKEEATKTALRSAIEQAYGTFVSANTTILDDDLVKDEIVTISKGNIKNYKEVSSSVLSNNRVFVTLQATVSISKLTSYAQSKGASTEFAGAAFGMNMKMAELNKQNEVSVLRNMTKQLQAMTNLFDFELELGEPKIDGRVAINLKHNKPQAVAFQHRYGKVPTEDFYVVGGKVKIKYNANTDMFNEIIFNTLQSLSLSQAEIDEMKKAGLKYYNYGTPYDKGMYLRNEYKYMSNAIYKYEEFMEMKDYELPIHFNHVNNPHWIGLSLYHLLVAKALDFKLSDNLTSPTELLVLNGEPKFTQAVWTYRAQQKKFNFDKVPKYSCKKTTKLGTEVGQIDIKIIIPQSEISKYNNFRVE